MQNRFSFWIFISSLLQLSFEIIEKCFQCYKFLNSNTSVGFWTLLCTRGQDSRIATDQTFAHTSNLLIASNTCTEIVFIVRQSSRVLSKDGVLGIWETIVIKLNLKQKIQKLNLFFKKLLVTFCLYLRIAGDVKDNKILNANFYNNIWFFTKFRPLYLYDN